MIDIDVTTGSFLWGYYTPESDMDRRGVFTFTLEDRLDPVNYHKGVHRRKIEVGYGGRKIETSSFEFSEFIKKLWYADINSWEAVVGHRFFGSGIIDRSYGSWGHQFMRDHAFNYLRPNLLRDACIRQSVHFRDRAMENYDSKASCHAIKSLLIAHYALDPNASYSASVDEIGSITSFMADLREGYDSGFLNQFHILTDKIQSLTLEPDSEDFTENWKRTAYIRSVYKETQRRADENR